MARLCDVLNLCYTAPVSDPNRPSSVPTRRTFLGAAAATALAPAACVAPRSTAASPSAAAEIQAARKAGTPSPDVEALLAQMTLDEKIGQMTQADQTALQDGQPVRDFF